MCKFLRITSYLALGSSIFWAYAYTGSYLGIKNGTVMAKVRFVL